MTSELRRPWRALLALLAFGWMSACGSSPLAPGGDDLPALAPDELRAEALGQRTVRLLWRRTPGARLYDVERRDSIGGAFSRIATTGSGQVGDTLVYVDTSLEPDRTYGYRIRVDTGVVSIVAGVRTPPPPSIAVVVQTSGTAAFADPDGYIVSVAGPDSSSQRASVNFSSGLPTAPPVPPVLFSPLRPGLYRVRITDLAANCGIGADFERALERTVSVTDSGVQTRRSVDAAIACENPALGAVVVRVAVANGVQSQNFEARLTSAAGSTPVLESLPIAGGGGSVQRRQLSPGSYQVELRGLRAPCRVAGAVAVPVSITAGTTDTVTYAVDCAQVPGGEFDPTGTDCEPGRPDQPIRFRLAWSSATVTPGSEVTLTLRAERGTGTFQLNSGALVIDGFTGGPLSVLATEAGADAVPTFGNTPPPVILSFVSTNPDGQPLPAEIARVRLRVNPNATPGRFCTRTLVSEISDLTGDPFPDRAIVLSEPLTIATSSGGGGTPPGGGGGGTPPSQGLPPVAVIGGAASLTAQTNVAITLSSAGSSDPSGGQLTYLWTLPGSSTPTSTQANPVVLYPDVGTYPVTLTVRNAAGLTGQTTKNIVVVPSTTNQPPQAGIDGAAVLTAQVGQPLVVTANASRDPDGTIVAYRWTFPGGSPATGVGVASNVTYSAPGTYVITLEVEDDRGGRASANKQVTVVAPPEARPFVLSQRFSPVENGTTVLTLSLDLSANLLQTPLPEQWRRVFLSSLSWDPAVLTPEALLPVDGLNSGPTSFPEAALGRISGLNATVIVGGRGGVADVFRIRFRVLAPSGRTTTTVSGLSILPTPEAGAGIVDNYAPFTRVLDGSFPPDGTTPPPTSTTGTVQGTVTRTGTGTQSLAGISVTVTPTGAAGIAANVTGTSGGASFVASTVPASTGGLVTVGGLPCGCTAPAASSYAAPGAGGTATVTLSVACDAPASPPAGASAAELRLQWSAVTAGTADLTMTYDPTTCDRAVNPACPLDRNFAGILGDVTLGGSAAGRVTDRSGQPTAGFGVATLGGTLPTTRFTAVSAAGGFSTAQPIIAIRFSFAAGAAGALTTSTLITEIVDGQGEVVPVSTGGATPTLRIIEATAQLP